MLFLAIALLVVPSLARSPLHPVVTGIYTDFGPLKEQTIVVQGRVDLETGVVTKQADLFFYLGSSGTFDGISTFDEKNGVFYYVNDFSDAYIHSAETIQAPFSIHAPIYLEGNGVESLAFDSVNRTLIATDFVKASNQFRLVLFPVDNLHLGPTIFTMPAGVEASLGAFDADRDEYYNVQVNSTNSSVLTSFNLHTGAVVRTLPVHCTVDKLWVDRAHPDFTSRLWGVHANGDLHYDIVNIDLQSGVCSMIPLKTSAGSIVTSFAFDGENGVLFYSDVGSSGNMLRSTSVRDGSSTELPLKSNFPFADIAVRFE